MLLCCVLQGVRLEEFEQVQTNSIKSLQRIITEQWIPSLKEAVTSQLQKVGKGWFNLQEQSRDVYMCSKLRKFMTRLKYMMETALRKLVQQSLESFVAYIEEAANYDIEVRPTPCLCCAVLCVLSCYDSMMVCSALHCIALQVVDTHTVHVTSKKKKGVAAAAAAAAAAEAKAPATPEKKVSYWQHLLSSLSPLLSSMLFSQQQQQERDRDGEEEAMPSIAEQVEERAQSEQALFSVDLVDVEHDHAGLSTKPSLFLDVPCLLFERAIEAVQVLYCTALPSH